MTRPLRKECPRAVSHITNQRKRGCSIKKPNTISMVAVVLVLTLVWAAATAAAEDKPENVIIMIADGCGSEQYTLARWYKGVPLSFDGILVGAVKTWIADSVIAESAATATAYATGYRTSDKFISVGPKKGTLPLMPEPSDEIQYRPLATVLEGARLKGMATGIVATSRVTHATPAAYIAHVSHRERENDIMEQAVHQNIDVVFGGGGRHLLPTAENGSRTDGENLLSTLRAHGYQVVENREEMMNLMKGRAYGMFASSHMQAELDRPEFAPAEPTLEEMTIKAIELLSQSPRGFFLMVEASQIDWACHANDPAHLLGDMMQYDRAVKAALDFAKKDGRTLVIALSDHDTGGMRIGNYATSKASSPIKIEQRTDPFGQITLLDPLKKMKLTAGGMWRRMENKVTPEKLKAVVKAYWGLDITNEDVNRIMEIGKEYKNNPHYGVGEVLSARYTMIGWSSHGHTGGDVPLYAYGPGSPKGLFDGPEIGLATARALDLDQDRLTGRLFVEATSAFRDGRVEMDLTDRHNPVVVVTGVAKTAKLPVNKNILIMDNKVIPLEGVVVYVPETKKAYIPLQAVNLIVDAKKPPPEITLTRE